MNDTKDSNIRNLILVGGGGHALSVIEAMGGSVSFAGYTAPHPSETIDLEWLGPDDSFAARGRDFHIAVVYSGMPEMSMRRRLIESFASRGAGFPALVAPSALVTPGSVVSEGCAVLCGAIVNRAVLHPHAIVNTGAVVEHGCEIGFNTFIGPGAVLGGNVTVGHDCFIGLGAKIRNNVTIAPGITVGMGSIVTRDLTEPGIYHGNPLRLHKPH